MSHYSTADDFVEVELSDVADDFEVIQETEAVATTEDDLDAPSDEFEFFVLVDGTWTSQEAVQRTATLRSLSRILASHDPSDTSCLGTEKCELCVNYITGLTTLYNCADEWVSTSRPFADMSPWTTRCLRSMPPATQRNFDDLLSHLLGDGWAKEDAEYQVTGDSEILAVLWALQVGPHGLLKGMTAGRDILSVLMDAEAAWVMENVDTEDLESKVKILTEFAGELCEWGRGLASKS